MDEDPSAKVPVTRAHRRLSVESEEANSPAPSTLTKKRGARLAAKPQLELISEVVTENVPKRTTRKAAVKEGVAPEEAAVTPSRRSTRIRSNTSVLSETTLTVESPRAIRALRRNSVLDNIAEMPANITIKSNKKKNKSDVSVNNVSMDDDPIVATQTLSAKKRPKKISMSAEDVEPLSQNTECEEYSRGVTEKVDYIPLLPEPETLSISAARCDYAGVELIVGGEDATQGEFPHMAAIGWANFQGGYSFFCGGSLISPRYVLSAGHCTDFKDTTLQIGTPNRLRSNKYSRYWGIALDILVTTYPIGTLEAPKQKKERIMM